MNPLDVKLKVSSHHHFLRVFLFIYFLLSLWDHFGVRLCVKMGVAVTVESLIKDPPNF